MSTIGEELNKSFSYEDKYIRFECVNRIKAEIICS